jgi:hypothetical protein
MKPSHTSLLRGRDLHEKAQVCISVVLKSKEMFEGEKKSINPSLTDFRSERHLQKNIAQ